MSDAQTSRKGPLNPPGQLPGYQLPLNFPRGTSDTGLLPSSVNSYDVEGGYALGRVMPTREIQMLQLMDSITDKSQWEDKVFDDAIASKWKAEALEDEKLGMTESMTDWVIQELRWKAESARKNGYVDVYPGDVVKSDVAVSQEIKLRLQKAIRVLEDVPEKDKDWHPDSDKKVLDLVHPSLFPLVYGSTRILPGHELVPLDSCKAFIGKGEVLPVPPENESSQEARSGRRRQDIESFSRKFQWLPCDIRPVKLSDDNDEVKTNAWRITSYINNLDPTKHKDMYDIVEQVFAAAVPLWNQTLDPLKNRHSIDEYHRIEYNSVAYTTGRDPEEILWETREGQDVEDEDEEEDPDDAMYYRVERARREALELPSPKAFQPPKVPVPGVRKYARMDLAEQFEDSGLQVIVKFANIHLTPEEPEYHGGSWHVEGKLNEHICATAIYYYDNENIGDSLLSFRHLGERDGVEEIGYAQNDQPVFGIDQEEAPLQILGSVSCRENRLVTFPNVLHHRVEPFGLADSTKPGHRKILALFLVDPNIRIISTAHVPPQQRHWWHGTLEAQNDTRIGGLPPELRNRIQDQMAPGDFPPSVEKAKEWREELMEERKDFVLKKDNEFDSYRISLCEH